MKELPSHVLKTTMNQKVEEPNKTNDGPPDGPIASDAQQKEIETEQKEIDTAVKVAPAEDAAEMPAEQKKWKILLVPQRKSGHLKNSIFN